ncbi:SRPBCC family protein [Nocardia sp. 348MFTsu5.1]|uniref:SRPBCC family protein n=1 Tax=Nocardia sp. 348MFTsu5.1 TaxID=1172185 RepID=UPI000380DBA1|nr:SRPBCC family protein [Nocardia sp. 348MFTsu5.1]
MTTTDTDLDLTVSRIIKAPRDVVWSAWADPAKFEQWWVPSPTTCKVVQMDLRPGGAFETEMSEDGGDFGPQINGCFLAVDNLERIVFTTALVAGWRPAREPFITAVITFADHPEGTEYVATAMHKDGAERDRHIDLGFHDGWGTVTRQLAELVERGA